MAKSMRSEEILTPQFRASFVNVFTPKTTQNGKQKYSVTMLIPKSEDISLLQQTVQSLAQAAYPEQWQYVLQESHPIKDGDTAPYKKGKNMGRRMCEVNPEMAGCWVVELTSNQKPPLVDHNVQPMIDPGQFHSGHWAWARVNAFSWGGEYMGISFGLNMLQKVPANGRDESPLGGGVAGDPAAAFAPIPADPSMAVQPPMMAPPPASQPAPVQQAPVAMNAPQYAPPPVPYPAPAPTPAPMQPTPVTTGQVFG
ncbi:DUF2815 family protein [bacterium]|nr:DUF2815 family protein [bacterium]